MNEGFAVTHAERVVYPSTGHTKGDVVAYYRAAAARILPHVAQRALTLKRFPKGLSGAGFFQKNVPPHYPASIARHAVARRNGTTTYPVVSDPAHLPYLANQGAIELHIPTDRTVFPFHPDRFVIDLDPPADSAALVREAALRTGDLLAELGLPTLPVATGSKGYHLVAHLVPSAAVDRVAEAAQQLGLLLEQRHPDLFTNAFQVARRGGRVFVDWMRNGPLATAIAPWSLRGQARPTVVCPMAWDQLEAPDAVELSGALDRPDPLAGLPAVDPEPILAGVGAAFRASGLTVEGGAGGRFR